MFKYLFLGLLFLFPSFSHAQVIVERTLLHPSLGESYLEQTGGDITSCYDGAGQWYIIRNFTVGVEPNITGGSIQNGVTALPS